MDDDGDGRGSVAVRDVELSELGTAAPVVVALDPQRGSYAATPSERNASASRVMPSSISSGVTPE